MAPPPLETAECGEPAGEVEIDDVIGDIEEADEESSIQPSTIHRGSTASLVSAVAIEARSAST